MRMRIAPSPPPVTLLAAASAHTFCVNKPCLFGSSVSTRAGRAQRRLREPGSRCGAHRGPRGALRGPVHLRRVRLQPCPDHRRRGWGDRAGHLPRARPATRQGRIEGRGRQAAAPPARRSRSRPASSSTARTPRTWRSATRGNSPARSVSSPKPTPHPEPRRRHVRWARCECRRTARRARPSAMRHCPQPTGLTRRMTQRHAPRRQDLRQAPGRRGASRRPPSS